MADEQPQKKPVEEKKEAAAVPPKPAPPGQPGSPLGEPAEKGRPDATPPASRPAPEAKPPRITTPAENARITPQATAAAPGSAEGTQPPTNPPAPTSPPTPAKSQPTSPPTPATAVGGTAKPAGAAPAAPAPLKAPAPPRPKTMTPEIQALMSAAGSTIQHLEDTDPNIPTILVEKSAFLGVMRRLKHEFGFDYLALITAVDIKENFEVIYNLWSYAKNRPLEVKVRTPRAEASVPSLCSLWSGANWLEREEWDLMGVRFEGHPDHRRILLPETWQGHPLRKDYDLKKEQFVGMNAEGDDVTYQEPREGAW